MANRNTETHFSNVAHAEIQRSTFDMGETLKTSFNAGDIIPIYLNQDILPGDTMTMYANGVVRMSTPLTPVMDDCYIDTYFFDIPYRLIWEHTKEFFGENKTGAWGISTEYTIPQMTADATNGIATGTIADYFGLPKGIPSITFSALPFRALTLVVNEWFRNQNFTAPYTEYTDDTTRSQDNTNPVLGGLPFKAMKYSDYFTSALPEAQKPYATIGTNGGVKLPLGTTAPVVGNGMTLGLISSGGGVKYTYGLAANQPVNSNTYLTPQPTTYGTNQGSTYTQNTINWSRTVGVTDDPAKSGLIADLTQATAASINALRLAFQTQRILERMAVSGTRYTEIIKGFFNVTSPDARLQRPEYLGGERNPISMNQVIQNSATDSVSPQGTTTAFSQTNATMGGFTKSFTEHSIVIGLGVVRQSHSYQQGLARSWSRLRLLDFYNPKLSHLGEMPIYKKEIYCDGTSADDDIWGYQERWAEYKFGLNKITGEMNSSYATPLDVWHYGDYYANRPSMGTSWLSETPNYIDRTLAIKSSSHNQFIADFYFNVKMTRPMPVYCTPGLLDHF